MSRRGQITMSDEEIVEFVDQRRVVVLATVKADGRPHLVPMWFVHNGPVIEVWSYARSQKTLNLRRDPRATLLLETGTEYAELRGVSLECDVELLESAEDVERIGSGLAVRYGTASPLDFSDEQARAALRAKAAKRVGLRFTPTRTISWDHRRLGGAY
ncbi:PPOX class probable F420-dependent enzyme [Saccharopolyspora kobensis]|uniref:PPOX class probable F420-dependent enzyme n=1 Tax=Saccharopolyspora kobensis TaxID=146035 RepID=A0A1H6DN84_9PSEU|nr:TIGR03618 family F420-dependent PPOX class oxidoreductase [Saccharopolyspora kobensis]SEG86729.1 PPOX class probable F420-dependent enzyme [Saccharopolyspora kobensis]SFF00550.1 PPOX class probable F420-dependent enzyme [Saccharopolyspora kobensis]